LLFFPRSARSRPVGRRGEIPFHRASSFKNKTKCFPRSIMQWAPTDQTSCKASFPLSRAVYPLFPHITACHFLGIQLFSAYRVPYGGTAQTICHHNGPACVAWMHAGKREILLRRPRAGGRALHFSRRKYTHHHDPCRVRSVLGNASFLWSLLYIYLYPM
jgi:hypothetical protein